MPSTRPPLIEGRYELGAVIGTGGMGEVRAARDVRLDRDVAVKLLHAALADRPGMRSRIRSEARAAAGLAHPNVVAVFDAGVDDAEHPFIVMERLDGRTLADELSAGPMPVDRARTMAIQVLDALQAAHDRGIVHRDVKPGNILVAGTDAWKVADFGIAKWLDDSGITRTGEVLGSPGYMAPERFEGTPASVSTDVYSAGVLLYEALTGRRPAEDEPALAAATAIREGRIPRVLELRPDAGPSLDGIVARAMAPDPADRFPTAREMADELRRSAASTVPLPPRTDEVAPTQRILPRSAAPADSPTTRRKARAPSVRGVVIAMLVGAALLLLLLIAGAAVVGGPRATRERTPAPLDLPAPVRDALDRLEDSIP